MRNRFRQRNNGGLAKVALAATLFFGIGTCVAGSHSNRQSYVGKVTNKESVNHGESSRYLIFTELNDGTAKVFENTDSLLEGKFNSSDVYGEIKEEKTYRFDTYGWRIPFLSWYENIVKAKEIPE